MLRRYLKEQAFDVDDHEYGIFDDTPAPPDQDISLPKGASHLKLTEVKK